MTRKSGLGAVRSWGTFWRGARDFLGISAQVGAKMGARWAKLGPSWQQVATKMGHDSAKMAILGSSWEVLGACWGHFGLFWHVLKNYSFLFYAMVCFLVHMYKVIIYLS